MIPASLKNIFKSIKRNRKLKHRKKLEKLKKITSEKDIKEKLQSVGLHEGDVIMVHSSLSAIGFVKDGAATVVKAFKTFVGSNGTLVMPSFPARGFNFNYLNTNPLFDLKFTRSKTGAVTEYFRRQPGVWRSLHPTDSVVAYGKNAEYITKDHFGQLTPYNSQSPFYKLIELNAKIVLLGVDLDSLTNLHTAEDAIPGFEYPVYHKKIFNTKLINSEGNLVYMETKVHDPEYSIKRQCNALLPHFELAGIVKHFSIGEAKCMVIDARAMHFWMIANYNSKGITLYSPDDKK